EAPRVGHGYDIHRLVEGRRLVLGGIEIPGPVGLLGHSDGDAVLHAAIEALLGAAGLPDIGEHFPDADPRFKDADSKRLLAETLAMLEARGLAPAHLDVSILAERPRLKAWKPAIKASLCERLRLPDDRVAVKARTNEGLDAVGRGEAIAVHCVAVAAPLRRL
ncbi:MAG TPA: 2-C-methyl-D-erythritol 2,4-cyclodiphosphate synthase, partial [Planctomycetota bacterium]|nr:2-C-methyl-D-erythritol 2,4-cyclodiphosphate synthase [Planctomycetota bacterium]